MTTAKSKRQISFECKQALCCCSTEMLWILLELGRGTGYLLGVLGSTRGDAEISCSSTACATRSMHQGDCAAKRNSMEPPEVAELSRTPTPQVPVNADCSMSPGNQLCAGPHCAWGSLLCCALAEAMRKDIRQRSPSGCSRRWAGSAAWMKPCAWDSSSQVLSQPGRDRENQQMGKALTREVGQHLPATVAVPSPAP